MYFFTHFTDLELNVVTNAFYLNNGLLFLKLVNLSEILFEVLKQH